jgi:hypothetical protein
MTRRGCIILKGTSPSLRNAPIVELVFEADKSLILGQIKLLVLK